MLETIYHGGDIVTMEHENDCPEAVVVRNGRIAYVGRLAEARRQFQEAEEVDLGGRTLLPSFIDAHSHICTYSRFADFADLSDCESFDDIVKTLEQYRAKRQGSGGVLIGAGYDHNFLKEQAHPTKELLDQISATDPVLLYHSSGHMGVANTALLRLAGIHNNTKDPAGAHYGRDASGLTGYAEELAALLPLLQTALKLAGGDRREQMRRVQDIYASYGVTTAQEGGTEPEALAELVQLAGEGILRLDVNAYVKDDGDPGAVLAAYPQARGRYWNRLKLPGAKIFLDGSPQGRSAWLSRPYEGEDTYCGYPACTDEIVEAAAGRAIEGGYQLLAHCNGDAAAGQYLRAYKKALDAAGRKEDLRPVMIHCQLIREDQLDEMAALSMLPSFFIAHTYYWGDVHLKNLGPLRGARISPAKSALERGLPFSLHQDCPVVKPDMMHTVWCAVNRLSRTGAPVGKEQCISVYEALKAVTVNAAYAYHEENDKGTLTPGKLADMAILEANPLKEDKMKLKDIRVYQTIKKGNILYTAERK